MDTLANQIFASILFSVLASTAVAQYVSPDTPAVRVDGRAFINVWQLRREVAAVEPLQATNETDECYSEGDEEGEEPISSEEQARIVAEQAKTEREESACERRISEAYTRYQSSGKDFNARWLPLMRNAIRKGDRVAEVIMRQCDTTPILDRSEIESTCDTNESRRTFAIKRLTEIDFIPALPFQPKLKPETRALLGSSAVQGIVLTANQEEALRRIPYGALGGFDFLSFYRGGNVAYTLEDVEQYRRCDLIVSVLNDAPRVFTVAFKGYDGDSPEQMASSRLGLSRKPASTRPYESCVPRDFYVRGVSATLDGRYRNSDSEKVPAVADPSSRRQLLLAMESNIDRYIKQDPRWAVFLLNRIGNNEWVPESAVDDSKDLSSAKQTARQATQKLLDELERDAKEKDTSDAFYRTASVETLIKTLARSRQEEFKYSPDRFPRNIKELEARRDSTPTLCSSYRSHPADDIVRFNLVMLIGHSLQDGRDDASLRDAAANCLTAALEDESSWVRAEAAYALRFHPLPTTRETLKKLHDSDHNLTVSRTTEQTLQQLGGTP